MADDVLTASDHFLSHHPDAQRWFVRVGSPAKWWQMDVKALEAEALRLEPHVRARLAERLFESLAEPSYPDIDRAWVEEALARGDELDAGETKAIPADEVIRKARARLG